MSQALKRQFTIEPANSFAFIDALWFCRAHALGAKKGFETSENVAARRVATRHAHAPALCSTSFPVRQRPNQHPCEFRDAAVKRK